MPTKGGRLKGSPTSSLLDLTKPGASRFVFGDLAFWVGLEGNLLYVWGRVEEEEEGFGR